MIPHDEIATLMQTVGDALERAEAGKIADGSMILLQGLQRANDLALAGDAWGEELRQRYQTAAADFARQYGLGLA
jgi:hypothetical protein